MVNTGFESYAGTRKLPWDTLGTVVENAMTAEEALRLAHLADWNVRKTPLQTWANDAAGESHLLTVPDQYAMVRNNPLTGEPEAFAGVNGKLFTPVQNEEHADFLNTLTDTSGAHIEAAGSLEGGRRVYVTMKFPESVSIAGIDTIDTYLTAINSHDGNSAFQVIVTPVRLECKNMIHGMIRGAKRSAKVRHTAGSGGAVARVRETLGLTFKYMEAFEAEAEKMIQREITSQRFGGIIANLYPTTDDQSDLVNNRAREHRANIRDLFENSATLGGIQQTAWAGYNAVTEYIDHFVAVRGTDDFEAAAEKRALFNFNGRTDELKENAFRLFANA